MRTLLLASVALGALWHPLSAQERPIEFSVDAGFSLNFHGEESSSLTFPSGYLHPGFYVSDRLEIEPLLSLFRFSESEEVCFSPTFCSRPAHIHARRPQRRPNPGETRVIGTQSASIIGLM